MDAWGQSLDLGEYQKLFLNLDGCPGPIPLFGWMLRANTLIWMDAWEQFIYLDGYPRPIPWFGGCLGQIPWFVCTQSHLSKLTLFNWISTSDTDARLMSGGSTPTPWEREKEGDQDLHLEGKHAEMHRVSVQLFGIWWFLKKVAQDRHFLLTVHGMLH